MTNVKRTPRYLMWSYCLLTIMCRLHLMKLVFAD